MAKDQHTIQPPNQSLKVNWLKNHMHTNHKCQPELAYLYACHCINCYNMKTKKPAENHYKFPLNGTIGKTGCNF